MTYIEVSDLIQAPRDRVFSIATDHMSWPKIFPHIKRVQVVQKTRGETMLKLETNGGARILITQRTRPCEKIVEDLRRRGIRGKSTYTFEALPEGTRVTLEFDAKAKGFYKLLHPFIGAYLRKQLQELVLGPMKQAAEGLAASNTSRQELVVGSHGLDASSSLNRYFDSAEATNGLTRTRDQGIEIPRT